MKTNIYLIGIAIMMMNCTSDVKKNEKEFQSFLNAFELVLKPLEKEAAFAAFNAAVSGKEEDYQKSAELTLRVTSLFQDSVAFNKLKNWKSSGLIQNELLKRQLDILYNHFLALQGDKALTEEIIRRANALEQKFSTYRIKINGKVLSDNQIDSILRNSVNSEELKKVWLASKTIGKEVAKDVIELVKLKNKSATALGFKNYYEMTLLLDEQDPDEIEKLFNELDTLTRETFKELKAEIDAHLSARLKIEPGKLMPWHYQNRFFQESIELGTINMDEFFKDKDIVKICKDFYKGIGMPVDTILSNSDLYEKPGKNQHAFCMDMDREGDVRILANVRNDAYWMNTMLHELGHAVYDKYHDASLPYCLREPAHIFTTEAIANLFGGMYSDPQWLQDNAGLTEEEKEKITPILKKNQQIEKLIFSRWCQVVFRFEKAMFENPDQDLNALWWNLVEKYQMLKRPENRNEPDWASKIHLALYQAYYHNYLLGDLLASQLLNYMNINVLDFSTHTISNNERVGEYLIENVFKPGSRYNWNEMIEKATGEPLTAKYYALQYLNTEE